MQELNEERIFMATSGEVATSEESLSKQGSVPPSAQTTEAKKFPVILEGYAMRIVTHHGGTKMDKTDDELAASAAAADENAFAELFRRYNASLVRLSCRRLRGDWFAAEEIAQATWLRAFTNLSRFNPRIRPFASWLHCIRIRLLIDHLRTRTDLAGIKEENEDGRLSELAKEGDTPTETLQAAIEELPADLKLAVTTTFIEDRSFADAARTLGLGIGTLHRRTTEAIRLLRQSLDVPPRPNVHRWAQPARKRPGREEIERLVA